MRISKSFQGSIVVEGTDALRLQLTRQVSHWAMAASRLGDLEDLAAASVWEGLEKYTGIVLRQNLSTAVERLQRQAATLQGQLNAARTRDEIDRISAALSTDGNVARFLCRCPQYSNQSKTCGTFAGL
jgi:hypothetical protein